MFLSKHNTRLTVKTHKVFIKKKEREKKEERINRKTKHKYNLTSHKMTRSRSLSFV